MELSGLSVRDWRALLTEYGRRDFEPSQWPYREAADIRSRWYENRVYLRGLIEVSSYCRQDCFYCGIRKSNQKALRYRLNQDEILESCRVGDALGFRTFVLQGGEDTFFSDHFLCGLVESIKRQYPDSAVTLSLGERSRASYAALKQAGADRYLLRHETADSQHFGKLHPRKQSLESRKKCLSDLKELGYQVGAGFMVGSPEQGVAQLAMDMCFLQDLQPHMVGIGPFIPHCDTPFGSRAPGGLGLTLLMLALTRIALPKVLLPSTTALGSIHPDGREMGLAAGANVVMPNLTPPVRRAAYSLYNGKLSAGAESAEGLRMLTTRLEAAGFAADMSRGDHPAYHQLTAGPGQPVAGRF